MEDTNKRAPLSPRPALQGSLCFSSPWDRSYASPDAGHRDAASLNFIPEIYPHYDCDARRYQREREVGVLLFGISVTFRLDALLKEVSLENLTQPGVGISPCKTVSRRDAAPEPTWMCSWRVLMGKSASGDPAYEAGINNLKKILIQAYSYPPIGYQNPSAVPSSRT